MFLLCFLGNDDFLPLKTNLRKMNWQLFYPLLINNYFANKIDATAKPV